MASDTTSAKITTRRATTSSSSSSSPIGTVADRASWYCAVVLLSLILVASVRQSSNSDDSFRGNRFLDRPCDEIYVVGEGETLHTISDKCSDPFIVERNPHIHDPDDVFPGLVIKITPSKRFD
ncbi:hypothetical protein CsatB_002983 [Cannabis sativa]|uniref:LysM domain-containing protein n=1 Tax=Cannabis sativa TaxID=3483 RepID=A0A7J6I0Y6_CANSA|nr:uncharacterized protein LOC115717438 [Cannabis sativa]KAF4371288.1 hypothetical protein F8388_023448 [Cannabis sativa]KAF4400759.1 hypothetical protein G4B88_001314 [Cannabis sativa]